VINELSFSLANTPGEIKVSAIASYVFGFVINI
jgi:hypothetical protein